MKTAKRKGSSKYKGKELQVAPYKVAKHVQKYYVKKKK
jgi:hypothetical protein